MPVVDQFVPILREAEAGKSIHDYLFTGPRGGFISSKNLSRALDWRRKRALVKAFAPGERAALHWRDLRHTAAVFFFDAGLPAPDVLALLGHSSLMVTQLYAGTRRLAARRSVEPLSAFFDAQSRGQLEGGEAPAMTGTTSPS